VEVGWALVEEALPTLEAEPTLVVLAFEVLEAADTEADREELDATETVEDADETLTLEDVGFAGPLVLEPLVLGEPPTELLGAPPEPTQLVLVPAMTVIGEVY